MSLKPILFYRILFIAILILLTKKFNLNFIVIEKMRYQLSCLTLALLPVNPDFSARVLVANGLINDSYMKNPNYRVNILSLSDSVYYDSLLTNLYKLTMYITHDKFLKAQIAQIYVAENSEFELIPRIGNHVILLGTADDLDDKFKRLYAFYRFGLNKIGWNKYNVINIKYRNQVVCSKI